MNEITKKELRELYFKKRLRLKNKLRSNSKINDKILDFFKKRKNETISGYFSVNGEVNPESALINLCKLGHRVCLPEIIKKDHRLVFKYWNKTTKMNNGKFGILVPSTNRLEIPNYLLVPILSFDIFKNRLGYGGGYYDRTIEKLQKKKIVFTVGIAFDEQENISIPVEKHDKKLNIIITPSRILS